MKLVYMFVLALLCGQLSAAALKVAPTPKKKKHQTTLNLYVFAKDLVPYLAKNKKAFLVDIRTPEELAFTGYATRTDIHVPLYLVDQSRASFNKKKKTYGLMNNRFKKQLLIEFKKLHVTKTSEIFMMCRSGSRSAKATNMLAKWGYKNVYTVLNGFEGHHAKTGNIGERTVNGWKNSGGKWSFKLNPQVIWFDDKYDN